MNTETIISPRWLIPVEPSNCVLEDHALVVAEDKITALLPVEEARQRYRHAEETRLEHHALLPGLINCHTHAAMSLFRGMADDLPLMTWLNEHIWPAEQRWVSPGFVTDGSKLAIAEMIRSGTTCFSDMYFFAEQTASVAITAGIRAVIGLIVIDFPTAWARDAKDYLHKAGQLHHQFRNAKLVSTAFAPHSPYAVHDRALARLNTLAEEMEIPIHMHVHETRDEIIQSLDKHGQRPLERLAGLGMLGPNMIAVHMTQLDDADLALVKHHGVNVVHCPESNLKLASGFCPVQRLLDMGINVALGTDGPASNNDLDMLAEMRTAALLAKGVAGDPAAVSAHEALQLATLNGARALGLDEITGSLRIGKQADMIAIDLGQLETQPLDDPVSQIVYSAGRHHVTDVWVAGRQLLQNRELMTMNEKETCRNAAAWSKKLYA